MIGLKDKTPRTMGRKASGPAQKAGFARRIARTPLAPVIAAMFAVVAAILVLATPAWLLESWVSALGLPALFPPAAPPLGNTARGLLALMVALGTGIGLFVLPFAATMVARKARSPKPMVRKRAAASSGAASVGDAPRAPIFAENELGSPFMSDEAREAGETLTLHAGDEAPGAVPVPENDADDPLLLEQAVPPFATMDAHEGGPFPQVDTPDMEASRLARILAAREPDADPVSPGFDGVFEGNDEAASAFAPQDGIETPNYHDMAPAVDEEPSSGDIARATLDALVQRLEFGVARRAHEGRPLRPPFAADARLAQLAGEDKRATA